MKKETNFKFNIIDVEKQIFEMAESRQLEDRALEMIAGGKMNNRFLASSLAAISLLTGTGMTTNPKVYASDPPPTSISQKLQQSIQEVQYFTKQQVIEDIDYVMDTLLKNHVGCIDGLPQEVLQQKELEIHNLSESTSSIEEWRIIARIMAKLHDAHSAILGPEFLSSKRLPFDIEYKDNKIFCSNGEFKGAEITEINGVKISDIYENFKLHYSHEIEEWTHVKFFRAPFIYPLALASAGIDTLKPVEVTFKNGNNISKQKFEFAKVDFVQRQPFVSYKIDKENGLGIFTLNQCNFNQEYCDAVDNFFADVAKNNVKNVAVDLRKNTGGSSNVMLYFAKYLNNLKSATTGKVEIRTSNGIEAFGGKTFTAKELKTLKSDKNLFDGKVFILTSNLTFSSAILFSSVFSDNNLATIVGEVPGNSPNHYGNVGIHDCTPNSKLQFTSTTKRFYRPDSTKDPDRLIPDVQVSAEEALNKTYELIKC